MAWGGDEAWRHIRPVYRSSWILSRPPPDRKLWDSDFDPEVPIRVYISRSLRFGSMNVPERGRFSISILLSLFPSRTPLLPVGCWQMLHFIEFRWIVARNRIMRSSVAINRSQEKERLDPSPISGLTIVRMWDTDMANQLCFALIVIITFLYL